MRRVIINNYDEDKEKQFDHCSVISETIDRDIYSRRKGQLECLSLSHSHDCLHRIDLPSSLGTCRYYEFLWIEKSKKDSSFSLS